MKLIIKILFFVLVALLVNVNVTIAAITFPNVQLKATSLYFHKETSKIVFKAVENDLVNYCQIGQNLLDYRNLAISSGANATMGGGCVFYRRRRMVICYSTPAPRDMRSSGFA